MGKMGPISRLDLSAKMSDLAQDHQAPIGKIHPAQGVAQDLRRSSLG